MPFVQRIVEPKFLSRTSLWDENGKPKIEDAELEAVTNNTLSNALRQLASILLVAEDIFTELGDQLKEINKRSEVLKIRINNVDKKVAEFDPKKVSVPESDICTFAHRREHYTRKHIFSSNLFSVETRPESLKALYSSATKTPVLLMRQLDRWRRDGQRSSKFFTCTPILGQKRRRIKCNGDIEIETSVPAAVGELRRWTSSEAIGDITVTPDCPIKIPSNISHCGENGDITDGTALSDDEGIDHKLPSPEEQVQVVALKFPSEIVAVDISGKVFDRMSFQRRSLMNGNEIPTRDGDGDRKKTRTRRPRSKRRNTLAGTDQKEIQNALIASEPQPSTSTQESQQPMRITGRSKSSDILRSNSKKDKESPENKKLSHFNTLKQWGRNRYDKLMNRSNEDKNKDKDIDEFNLYETVTMKRRRNIDKKSSQHRSSSVSSSEKSSGVNIPVNSTLMNLAVRLRESSLQRRERRKGKKDEQPHSSSGNWSASSESGRNSIGSEITTSTTQPKSTSATTSNNSLNFAPPSSICSRRKFLTSGSSSVTSEGTLTPDIIHDLHEDGETSSIYSCDTEGYYTSFHVDSGLKTLKEEELPPTPLHCSNTLDNDENDHSVENEYELFGKGSTSTTTSSAGTICTTLKISEGNLTGPAVPERKSSLKSPESSLERDSDKTGTVKRSPAMKLENRTNDDKRSDGGVSPDSGHNTSSSPIESTSSPNGMRSCSEFEFSESSDMEGAERIERIRVKTTINSSRIPSMCVITPSQSDDESSSHSSNSNENSRKLEGTDKLIRVNKETGYATLETIERNGEINSNIANVNSNIRAPSPSGGTVIIRDEVPKLNTATQIPIFKSTLLPLNNVFDKIRTNLSNFKARKDDKSPNRNMNCNNEDLGEYVTITDVKNNNNTNTNNKNNNRSDKIENTYVNDIVNKNLKTILSGNIRETEYVSLNELPNVNLNCSNTVNSSSTNNDSLERKKRGARVTLDAEGKVVYSSDSLKRKKGPQSTFEPGPFVKTISSNPSPITTNHRNVKTVRAVATTPTMGRVIIRASSANETSTLEKEIIRVPSSIVTSARKQPLMIPTSPNKRCGAYVRMDTTKIQERTPHMVSERTMYQSVPEFNQQYDVSRYPESIYSENHGNYYLGRGTRYQTLPTRKTQILYKDFQPERSVTPDITRGLEKFHPNYYEDDSLLNQQLGIPSSFPSSPGKEAFKNIDEIRISPIDPRSSGSFKSSTPSTSQLKSAVNLDNSFLSPKKSTMSNEELYAVIHKSKKKMNIKTDEENKCPPLPISNNMQKFDENIQQIEKMKIPETGYLSDRVRTRLSWSPNSHKLEEKAEISPTKENFMTSRSRQSWASPSKDRKIPQTSRLDFKKLLLQKSNNLIPSTKKPSAVEQLKLSKQQIQVTQKVIQPSINSNVLPEMNILELSGSPRSLINRRFQNPPSSPTKNSSEKSKQTKLMMSPNRSQWRFPNPRSDVLSSTILEDCREDDPNSSGEKKISPKIIGAVKKTTKNDVHVLPISQRIQAKRAEFFGKVFNENDNKTKIPALETSL